MLSPSLLSSFIGAFFHFSPFTCHYFSDICRRWRWCFIYRFSSSRDYFFLFWLLPLLIFFFHCHHWLTFRCHMITPLRRRFILMPITIHWFLFITPWHYFISLASPLIYFIRQRHTMLDYAVAGDIAADTLIRHFRHSWLRCCCCFASP